MISAILDIVTLVLCVACVVTLCITLYKYRYKNHLLDNVETIYCWVECVLISMMFVYVLMKLIGGMG